MYKLDTRPTMTAKCYIDPKYEWVALKRAVVKEFLGPKVAEISKYSYQRGQTVYLDMDRDYPMFLRCAHAKNYLVQLEDKWTKKASPIRNYDPFCEVD